MVKSFGIVMMLLVAACAKKSNSAADANGSGVHDDAALAVDADDDAPPDAPPRAVCPGALPDGAMNQNYVIFGGTFVTEAVESWNWTVVGGLCDELHKALGAAPSYTLAGQVTQSLTFTPTQPGDYTISVTITFTDQTTVTCAFTVHVAGVGLRVELCWDTEGQSDLDLHLHRPGSTTNWLGVGNNDECGYPNCGAMVTSARANWNYANTSLGAGCGSSWNTLGYCPNPRLESDNVSTKGRVELIVIDAPSDTSTYRILTQYYSGSLVTHPVVNIYCGGHLAETYGAAADVVTTFTSGGTANRPLWRVADVTTTVVGGVTTCTVAPIHPPGTTAGYYVTTSSDVSF